MERTPSSRLRGLLGSLRIVIGVLLVIAGTSLVPFGFSFAFGPVPWPTYEVFLVELGGLVALVAGAILFVLGGLDMARTARAARRAGAQGGPCAILERRTAIRVAALSVVSVVALVAITLLAWPWIEGPPRSQIVVADSQYVASCISMYGAYVQRYDWSFRLANSGTANGVANLTFLVDNVTVDFAYYFVARGASFEGFRFVFGSVRTSGCVNEVPTLRIANVTTV